GEQGLREQWVPRTDAPVRGEVAVPHGGADAQAAAVRVVDRAVRKPRNVDEHVRPLDAEAHEVDEVRAAAQELRVRKCVDRRDCSCAVRRALVAKRLHYATSSIAATMFGYAPQRQMLPLMRSRISCASRLGDVRSRET